MEDTNGAASTATVTITIQGSNDTPVAIADTNNAYEAGGVANGSAGINPAAMYSAMIPMSMQSPMAKPKL